MKTATKASRIARSILRFAPCAIAVSLFGAAQLVAAQTSLPPAERPVLMASAGSLPEAPDAVVAASSSSIPAESLDDAQARTSSVSLARPMASTTDKYIAPGQAVPSLTVANKFALGIKDAVSPLSFIGWAASAGYEQATNGSPNYGQTGKGFAQRLGAAAARASSEGIFSDSVLDSALHEDPRYYRMGPGHNFFKRVVYAGTRTLITRTDSGRTTPNFALLGGNLGGAYLTKTYYPPLNTSNSEVLKTFGGSVGGSALGFLVSEFLSGGLNIFHASKPATN